MDRKIAKLNVEHYRRLLTEESDERKRETIRELLAAEEAKLRKLEPPARDPKDQY